MTEARNEAVGQEITINGLPIMLEQPRGPWDIADLDLYYRDCVIGGAGAFMIPIRERHQFLEAIRTKIVREVSNQQMPETFVHRAQVDTPPDCSASGFRPRRPAEE